MFIVLLILAAEGTFGRKTSLCLREAYFALMTVKGALESRAASSEALAPEAKATRNTVLRVTSLNEADLKGSNGGPFN